MSEIEGNQLQEEIERIAEGEVVGQAISAAADGSYLGAFNVAAVGAEVGEKAEMNHTASPQGPDTPGC